MSRVHRGFLSTMAFMGVTVTSVSAQHITEYIRHIPLQAPIIIGQTTANQRLCLWGSTPTSPCALGPNDPADWRDDDGNGIADIRDTVLLKLAKAFSPILFRNTTAVPMDARRFTALPLTIDRWDLASDSVPVVDSRTITLSTVARDPCPVHDQAARVASRRPDCELLRLIKELLPLSVLDTPKANSQTAPVTAAEQANRARRPDSVALRPGMQLASAPAPTVLPDADGVTPVRAPDPVPRDPVVLPSVIQPGGDTLSVLYIDLPGEGESSWKREYVQNYSGKLPRSLERTQKIYAHPFIHRIIQTDTPGAPPDTLYEFVMQYWFFYPFNDGGNNHEGDWEHINVVLALKSDVIAGKDSQKDVALADERSQLSEAQIASILGGDVVAASDMSAMPDERQQLVIARVDYYFHRKVQTVSYLVPNAYRLERCVSQPSVNDKMACRNSVADSVVASVPEEVRGEKMQWHQMLYRAYPDETAWRWFLAPRDSSVKEPRYPGLMVNTHPIGFIGGDNKGFDQLLALPGGKNRDSHGTYPFAGVYKGVGPGAAEQVTQKSDRREDFLGSPEEIELLADWERLLPLTLRGSQSRQDWSWFLLPIRWGYPAVGSPFAGAIANVDLGNVAVVGPAYNTGWNRVGDARGYASYVPHTFKGEPRLDWVGQFENGLGFFNVITASLQVVPPADLAFEAIRLTFKLAAKSADLAFKVGKVPVLTVLQPARHAPRLFRRGRWTLIPPVFSGGSRRRKRPSQTFVPADDIPFRLTGLGFGLSLNRIPDDIALLLIDTAQVNNTVLLDGAGGRDSIVRVFNPVASTAGMIEVNWNFFVGRQFVSETQFRCTCLGKPTMRVSLRASTDSVPNGDDIIDPSVEETVQRADRVISGDLQIYELNGSVRVNLATGVFQPYLKLGAGVVWFQVGSIGAGIREDSLPRTPPNLLVGSTKVDQSRRVAWLLGAGLEWIPFKSQRDPPSFLGVPLPGRRGYDLGVRAEVALRVRKLDIATPFEVVGITDRNTVWPQFNVSITVSR